MKPENCTGQQIVHGLAALCCLRIAAAACCAIKRYTPYFSWGYGAILHSPHRIAEVDSDWVQAIAYAEPREQATARHARAWKVRH